MALSAGEPWYVVRERYRLSYKCNAGGVKMRMIGSGKASREH